MIKNKIWFLLVIMVIITLVFVGFLLPRETKPSADTRVILEHTHNTYIAPACFEESNATNFVEESTLEKAQELNYPPDSACTADAIKSENDRLIPSLLKEFGFIKNK